MKWTVTGLMTAALMSIAPITPAQADSGTPVPSHASWAVEDSLTMTWRSPTHTPTVTVDVLANDQGAVEVLDASFIEHVSPFVLPPGQTISHDGSRVTIKLPAWEPTSWSSRMVDATITVRNADGETAIEWLTVVEHLPQYEPGTALKALDDKAVVPRMVHTTVINLVSNDTASTSGHMWVGRVSWSPVARVLTPRGIKRLKVERPVGSEQWSAGHLIVQLPRVRSKYPVEFRGKYVLRGLSGERRTAHVTITSSPKKSA